MGLFPQVPLLVPQVGTSRTRKMSVCQLFVSSQKDISYYLTSSPSNCKGIRSELQIFFKKNSFIGKSLRCYFSHFAVDQCGRSDGYLLTPGTSECVTLSDNREFR